MRDGWRWMAGMLMVVGCTTASAETGQAIIDATEDGSRVMGTAMLTETPGGLQVIAQVSGVAPGKHGIHIHQFGACDEGGKAAGGHFNPAGVPHGFLPEDGSGRAHVGDLGNIMVGEDGAGDLTVMLPSVKLGSGPSSVAGRAIILHAQEDDFGQPTGNAGGRIGCGPIVIIRE